MLSLNSLTKKFGDFTAVNNLTLNVNKGELFGFLGPNGAGKTTTIKMITGLYAPTSGSVTIDGKDLSKNSIECKSVIGYVPDQPFLYDKITGFEFLQFCGGLYCKNGKELNNRILNLVELLKIGDWLHKRSEEYSQGMRQRITIASAILHDPKLIIIDEPMVGLDPQSAFIIKDVLRKKTKEGCAILMSTHSLNMVEEVCTRVGILRNGELIFENTIEELNNQKNKHNSNLEKFFIELTEDE